MNSNKEKYKFLRTYMKLKLLKIIPKFNLKKYNTLYILIFLCITFCATLIIYCMFNDWYSDKNNINALITEIHGTFIEVFFFAIIMNKIIELRDKKNVKKFRAFYYSTLLEEIENYLKRIHYNNCKIEGYACYNDNIIPIHNYNFDELCYTKNYLKKYNFELLDDEIFNLAYANKIDKYYLDRYSLPKRTLQKKLKNILLEVKLLFEQDLIFELTKVLNSNDKLYEVEKNIVKSIFNYEDLIKLLNEFMYREFLKDLLIFRHSLIKCSDKILSVKEKELYDLEKSKEIAELLKNM